MVNDEHIYIPLTDIGKFHSIFHSIPFDSIPRVTRYAAIHERESSVVPRTDILLSCVHCELSQMRAAAG